MIMYLVFAMAGLLVVAVLLEFKIHRVEREHRETCNNCKDIFKHKENCRRCRIADWLKV